MGQRGTPGAALLNLAAQVQSWLAGRMPNVWAQVHTTWLRTLTCMLKHTRLAGA